MNASQYQTALKLTFCREALERIFRETAPGDPSHAVARDALVRIGELPEPQPVRLEDETPTLETIPAFADPLSSLFD